MQTSSLYHCTVGSGFPSALHDNELVSPSFTVISDSNFVNTDGLIWCSGSHSNEKYFF